MKAMFTGWIIVLIVIVVFVVLLQRGNDQSKSTTTIASEVKIDVIPPWNPSGDKSMAYNYFLYSEAVANFLSYVDKDDKRNRIITQKILQDIIDKINLTLDPDISKINTYEADKAFVKYFLAIKEKPVLNENSADYVPLFDNSLMLGLKSSTIKMGFENVVSSHGYLSEREKKEIETQFDESLELCQKLEMPAKITDDLKRIKADFTDVAEHKYTTFSQDFNKWYHNVELIYTN